MAPRTPSRRLFLLAAGASSVLAAAANADRLRLLKGGPGPDTAPDSPITITTKTGQPLDTLVYSDPVTPTGYNTPTTITAVGGFVSVEGGGNTTSTTINPGQSFRAVRQSSTSNSTTLTVTGTVGGVAWSFGVRTEAAVPIGAVQMRSNDEQVIDVSTLYAAMYDRPYSADRINVTNNGAALEAQIWLMGPTGYLPLANGETFGCTGGDLDHFIVKTTGMADGDTQTITFAGTNSATGLPETQTLTIVCVDDPTTLPTWDMGIDTLGLFGGFPIHEKLQGNPQHWSVKTEASNFDGVTNRFTVIYDPTARTETNSSGRTYSQGLARLVRNGLAGTAGTLNCSMRTNGANGTTGTINTAPWTVYGGDPVGAAPTAGGITTVTLQNSDGLPDRIVPIRWVANQCDVAQWPLLDGITAASDSPAHQRGWAMRRGSAIFKRGSTLMLEVGDHQDLVRQWRIGFTLGFGPTTLGNATAPTGIFVLGSGKYTPVTDVLVATEGAAIDPQFITWRGRTHRAFLDHPKGIATTSINTTTTNILGLRITNLRLGSGPGFFDTPVRWVVIDHCSGARGDGKVSTHDSGTDVVSGACYIRNFTYQTQMAGQDMQRWGNRSQGIAYGVPTVSVPGANELTNSGVNTGQPYGGVDTWKLSASRWNSDDNVRRAQDVFNFDFDPKAADDFGHWDFEQWVANTTANAYRMGPRVIGKLMWCGTGRNSTGTWSARPLPGFPSDTGKMLPGRNEGYFHNRAVGYTGVTDYQFAGLILMDRQQNAIALANMGRNSWWKYCALFYPQYVPPQGVTSDASVPEFSPEVPAGAEDLASIKITNNIFCSGLSGGNNSTYANNYTQARVGGAGAAFLARMNDFARDPGLCKNIADVMDMIGFVSGQEVDAGPFAPNALAMMDYRRRVFDPAALFV